ncbi:ATP-binding protein, partial [Candidatus Riflebacteria bacterium]
YFSYKKRWDFFQTDIKRDILYLGNALKSIAEDTWQEKGEKEVLKMIENLNQKKHPVKVRWIWVDSKKGSYFYPRVMKARLKSLKDGKPLCFFISTVSGKTSIISYFPLKISTVSQAAIELSESLLPFEKVVAHSLYRSFLLFFLLILTAFCIIFISGYWIIRPPLNKMIKKLKKAGEGNFNYPLIINSDDEFGELSLAINDMCENLSKALDRVLVEGQLRKEAIEQLRHSDRLTSIGKFAAGIAHEIGTPLNIITGRAEMIYEGNLANDEILKYVRVMDKQAQRITTIIRQLLDFARRSEPQLRPINLVESISRVIKLLSLLARKQKIQIHFNKNQPPFISLGDISQIEQVFFNIIGNGIQAMSEGGKMEIDLKIEYKDCPPEMVQKKGKFIIISFSDSGIGINEEDQKHIFEPFFTTKEFGKGTGLGLSIAYGIIREHGGWIELESKFGKGSIFKVFLPCKEEIKCLEES